MKDYRLCGAAWLPATALTLGFRYPSIVLTGIAVGGCLFEWFDVGLECLRFVLSVAKLVSNALKPRFFTTFCLYKKSGDISNVLGP